MGWKSLVSVFVVSSLVVTGYCYSDVIFRFFSGIFRGAPKPSGDGVSALATASEEAKALCAASQQRLASSSVPAICSSPEQALVPAIQNVDSITQVAGCVTTSNSEAVLANQLIGPSNSLCTINNSKATTRSSSLAADLMDVPMQFKVSKEQFLIEEALRVQLQAEMAIAQFTGFKG